MKKLDLNAYGVEKMSIAEMQETDGGFALLKLGIAAAGLLALSLELTERVGYSVGRSRCVC